MLTIFKHRAATCSALLATTMLAGANLAEAKPANLKSMSFHAYNATQELHVISKDGKTWTDFKSGNIPFSANLSIDTKGTGYVDRAGVVLGTCSGDSCQTFPILWSSYIIARDWSANSAPFIFNGANIPLGDADSIAIMPEGKQIMDRCNTKLAADGPTKSHSFFHTMSATFVAETDRIGILDYIQPEAGFAFPSSVHHWPSDTFQVKVVCDAVIKIQNDDIAVAQPEFQAEGIKLFLATYSHGNNNNPNPATKCAALKVTTRVQTSKAGGVDVRLWRKVGAGPTTNEFMSAYASFDAAKNGYFADFVRTEKPDATTYLQYMAEVVGGTFAPSTPWKDITVHCTGAGGGGLSNGQQDTGTEDPIPVPPKKPKPQVDQASDDLAGQPQPDPDKPKATWAGTVTLADSAGTKKRCPRKGQAVFAVTRDAPGNFKYKLSCSNGQGFSGSVVSYSQGGPTFEAYGAHDLNINRTRTIQCTLQEVKDSGARVTLDKGAFDYTCNKPAIDPQADDLAVPQNPPKSSHAEPVPTPDVSIFCKPGFKLVGKKCLKKPVIAVLCKPGFLLKGKACVKKPVVSILCAKGFKLEGKKCVKLPRLVSRAKPRRAVVVR